MMKHKVVLNLLLLLGCLDNALHKTPQEKFILYACFFKKLSDRNKEMIHLPHLFSIQRIKNPPHKAFSSKKVTQSLKNSMTLRTLFLDSMRK